MQISPWKAVVFSFAFLISLGTILLMLPLSGGVPFLDALFTSASASCVAGLSVIDISKLSWFGKSVVLFLMQVGGLGVMTFSFFFMFAVGSPTMRAKITAGKLFDVQNWSRVKRFVWTIVWSTVLMELLGFFGLYRAMLANFPQGTAAFNAVFQSVSSFCNCGLDMTGGNFDIISRDSLAVWTTTVLTVLGGIGFVVLGWISEFLQALIRGRRLPRAPLHVKLVLASSAILFSVPFFATMMGASFPGWATLWDKISMSACYSASLRSSGFAVLRLDVVAPWLLMLSIATMFIGASPGSCGGGIKSTTATVFFLSAKTVLSGKVDRLSVFGRAIADSIVLRASAVVLTSLFFLLSFSFLLMLTDGSLGFLDLLFETTSAFATCGLSTGITKLISPMGRLVLVAAMFVGRVGPMTVALAVSEKGSVSAEKKFEEGRFSVVAGRAE